MSSKGPCIKGLVSNLWCHWEEVQALRDSALWQNIRSFGACLQRESWGPCLSCSSLFYLLATMRWTACSTTHCPPCSLSNTKNNRAKQPYTETCKTGSQTKFFFLLSWLSQVFCYSNTKLTQKTGKLAHWEVPLRGILGPQSTSSFLFSFPDTMNEQFAPPSTPHHDVLPHHRPKTEISKSVSQN